MNPVSATVRWVKDVHTLSFEVRPPASASSGTVTGSVDFYVGPILVAQAWVKMAVVTSNESTEEQDILGPVAKVTHRRTFVLRARDFPPVPVLGQQIPASGTFRTSNALKSPFLAASNLE